MEEREIDRTELYVADEVFLCGTGLEVTSVGAVDRFDVGDGGPGPGPLTAAVRETYVAMATGKSGLHSEWLEQVYD